MYFYQTNEPLQAYIDIAGVVFLANNSVNTASATMKLDQNLVRLTP